MNTLIFDVETVGEKWDDLDETTQSVLKYRIKTDPSEAELYEREMGYLKDGLGFSPLTGEVVSVGVLNYEKNEGCEYYQAPGSSSKALKEAGFDFKVMNEAEILSKFWELAKFHDTFVTFNGRSFDVPFLMVRSAIHKIKPTKDLMSNRYLSSQKFAAKHIDLFDQLSFYSAFRNAGGLHLWSRAFGIKSPKEDGVSGDEVAKLFDEKRYLDIARYNVRDVLATRDLYEYWKSYLSL